MTLKRKISTNGSATHYYNATLAFTAKRTTNNTYMIRSKKVDLPAKGDVITMELGNTSIRGTNNSYKVLSIDTDTGVAKVTALYDVIKTAWHDSWQIGTKDCYKDSKIADYLEDTWYTSLTDAAKNAIVSETFTQDVWDYATATESSWYGFYTSGGAKNQYKLVNSTGYSEITAHAHILSITEITEYLQNSNKYATYEDLISIFGDAATSSAPVWLLSDYTGDSGKVFHCPATGSVFSYGNCSNSEYYARPTFKINMTKIGWTKE